MEAKARERQTPLHIASRLGNVDIAVLLLQHGADVRAMTADHYNALHIAAKQHNHDVSSGSGGLSGRRDSKVKVLQRRNVTHVFC